MDNQLVTVKITTSDGAAYNLELGFTPAKVVAKNVSTGVVYFWDNSMADGSYIDDATTYATSNGFTPYAGSATAQKGITLGSVIMGSSDDVINVECHRGYNLTAITV